MMKWGGSMAAVLLVLAAALLRAQDTPATPALPQPGTVRVVAGELAVVQVYFDFLAQGRAGLIRVAGADMATVEATLFDVAAPLRFFRVPNDPGYYAFVVTALDQAMRTYELRVTVASAAGATETLTIPVTVDSGGFIRQDVLLTGEKAFLVNPEIENGELTRLFELAAPYTEAKLWGATGFHLPTDAAATSPFGAVRVFNGSLNTLHTGWDFQAAMGEPVVATAGGVVAFTGRLDIRGNYVLIDHGYGIYSGYAHLSVIYVTQGQPVNTGQIIGQVGSTGRSSSPHAHFEMIADGKWVDPLDFVRMYVP
ncbi:MAG: M23 family metallopeptidase [Anaerolineae bacterium]|jgi:murein DD-endopeptidase MepM/ murein hydrolase activator NlpD|nr:M23 family metallopeptidase [Anaerolineae bacterium]